MIHIITQKGKGFLPAESASDKMHGVGPYDPLTGKQDKKKPKVSRLCWAVGDPCPGPPCICQDWHATLKAD